MSDDFLSLVNFPPEFALDWLPPGEADGRFVSLEIREKTVSHNPS